MFVEIFSSYCIALYHRKQHVCEQIRVVILSSQDLIRDVLLKDLHAEIHFARVFMKPGYDTPITDTDPLSFCHAVFNVVAHFLCSCVFHIT